MGFDLLMLRVWDAAAFTHTHIYIYIVNIQAHIVLYVYVQMYVDTSVCVDIYVWVYICMFIAILRAITVITTFTITAVAVTTINFTGYCVHGCGSYCDCFVVTSIHMLSKTYLYMYISMYIGSLRVHTTSPAYADVNSDHLASQRDPALFSAQADGTWM